MACAVQYEQRTERVSAAVIALLLEDVACHLIFIVVLGHIGWAYRVLD